jgi:serine/threonine protein kinase
MQKIQGSDLFDDFFEYQDKIYDKDENVADAAQQKIEKQVIKPALEVSKKIGEHGFLMIDNKPENIMMDRKTGKMYIIDFGGFVDFSEDEQTKTMYGRLNRWIFLLNIYKQFHPFTTEGPTFNTYISTMLSSKIKPFIYEIYENYKPQIHDYYLKNRKGFRNTYDYVGYNVALNLKSIVHIPDDNKNKKRKLDS